MKRLFGVILIFSILLLSNHHLNAQESAPKTKYMVWEIKVTPVQLESLLAALKSQNEFLKEQNYPFPNITQYTSDGYLWYSVPFTNYADIDKIEAASQKLWKENSDKSKELQEQFKDAFSAIGGLILEAQPELSILPGESSVTPKGKKFRFFEKFYIKYGKEKEFEELIKRYVAMRKNHDIQDAFYTLYPAFAPDMNVVYFIDETGNNAAEHYTQNEKHWQMFGEEGEQLWEDVKHLVSKIETHLGTIDYEVSYFPAN
ncbi:hypothetical protein [uncultured Draconibacterium sp.]|uniref:hypothetical protein n=1 Tax=uncultured Draconibacterium sp. TaxID=1573823 RepID=UPI003260BF04